VLSADKTSVIEGMLPRGDANTAPPRGLASMAAGLPVCLPQKADSEPPSHALCVLFKGGAESFFEHLLLAQDEDPVEQDRQGRNGNPGTDRSLKDGGSSYDEDHPKIHGIAVPPEYAIRGQRVRSLEWLNGGAEPLQLTVCRNVQRNTSGNGKKPGKAPGHWDGHRQRNKKVRGDRQPYGRKEVDRWQYPCHPQPLIARHPWIKASLCNDRAA
jgi:hypothetical protein